MNSYYNDGTGLGGNPYEDILHVDDNDRFLGVNKENPECEVDVEGKVQCDTLTVNGTASIKSKTTISDTLTVSDINTWEVGVLGGGNLSLTGNVRFLNENRILSRFAPDGTETRFVDSGIEQLFDDVIVEQDGFEFVRRKIDYEKWIYNNPMFPNGKFPKSGADWLTWLNTIANLAQLGDQFFDAAGFLLSSGAAGSLGAALSGAAAAGKSALCGVKKFLGLGGCDEGGSDGQDGEDGADGDDANVTNIWLSFPRITSCPFAYHRDLNALPFLNPFEPTDNNSYFPMLKDVTLKKDLYAKTTSRWYLTDHLKYKELSRGRETNATDLDDDSKRWTLIDFNDKVMHLNGIDIDEFNRTSNTIYLADHEAYTGYNQRPLVRLNKNGLHMFSYDPILGTQTQKTVLDLVDRKFNIDTVETKLVDIHNVPTNPFDSVPVLKVNGNTIIDSDGLIDVNRIRGLSSQLEKLNDNMLTRVADGRIQMNDRAFNLTNNPVFNDGIGSLEPQTISGYRAPINPTPELPMPDPWSELLFNNTIARLPNPDMNTPLLDLFLL